MKTCPRCESSIDNEARYCLECGAPQTEAAAEELDEYVQQQAQQVAADSRATGAKTESEASNEDTATVVTEKLTDRQQLWRRGCYVVGYGTIVVALTLIPQLGAFSLILGGIAILPPIRRLTTAPFGSPLKREAMAGMYAVLVLVGTALLIVM